MKSVRLAEVILDHPFPSLRSLPPLCGPLQVHQHSLSSKSLLLFFRTLPWVITIPQVRANRLVLPLASTHAGVTGIGISGTPMAAAPTAAVTYVAMMPTPAFYSPTGHIYAASPNRCTILSSPLLYVCVLVLM